jgi:hypothetical protein
MTGESESIPLILRIPKSVWLRKTIVANKILSTTQNESTSITNKSNSPGVKKSKKANRYFQTSKEMIDYINSLYTSLSTTTTSHQSQQLLHSDVNSIEFDGMSCMTIENAVNHITTLRLEYIQRLLRPLLSR